MFLRNDREYYYNYFYLASYILSHMIIKALNCEKNLWLVTGE